jgi:hypothetical protein
MRTCIFCDNPVNSKEDAWPSWLVREFNGTEKGIVEGQRGQQSSYSWHAGKYPLRTGNVCKKCNNGWMSDLENRVKPILERFFLYDQVSLDQRDQSTLALWICKNAMVYETLRLNAANFYTSQERILFRESFHLPPQTFIWIAKVVGFTGMFCNASDIQGNVFETLEKVNAYSTSMAFGPFAGQILNIKMSKSIHQNILMTENLYPESFNQTIIQIWPIIADSITWPNKIGLSGELGLGYFANRWHQPSAI